MTPLEIAKIFNAVGVTVMLAVSLLIGARYPSPFFRSWARALSVGWVFMAFEWLTTYLGRPGWYAVLAAALITLMTAYLVEAGRAFDRPPFPPRALAAATGAAAAIALGLTAAGAPFDAAVGPFAVAFAVAHVWTGWRVFTSRPASHRGGTWILGAPLVATGLWMFTYPFFLTSPYGWFGYLVSSVLNLAVGMGLVAYLVEEATLALAAKNEELTRLDALKTAFIRTMSHELRTPLTAIMAASSLLREGPRPLADPVQQELATTISDQSELLARVVGEVLDYAQLEAGTMAYARTATDLRDVAARGARAMGPVAAERDLALVYEDAPAPVMAEVDPHRLAQVVLNLITNAMKFTPPGGTITLAAWRADGEACLAVQDTGVGIAPEHHEAIFERFYQVDPTSTRKSGGMGLGLALCRAIVEDGHGGRIRVESEPGKGSRFVVALPAVAG